MIRYTFAASLMLATSPAGALPVCEGGNRAERKLTCIVDGDGRLAGTALMAEGLAQPWPNEGNVWCSE